MVKNGVSQSTQCNIQVITAMQQYQHKSVDELRYEDYMRGNKGGQAAGGLGGLGGGGMFGGGLAKPAGLSFGSTPAATTGFGGTSFGGAGSTLGSPFGNAGAQGAAPGGAFGGGGAFGATNTGATGGFGGFGGGAPATGAFGSPVPAAGGFALGGTTTAPNAFGGGGAFGAPVGGATAPAFGGFGQTQPAAGAGAFGAPAAGGAFGGFGQTQAPKPAASFGGFGGAAAGTTNAFGAPGAFGSPAGATNAFGGAPGAAAAPAAGGGFGGFGGLGGTTTLGGAFGKPATGAAGGFGNLGAFGGAPAGGAFGTAPAGGAFGTPGAGTFGSTQPTPAFGAAPASGGFGGFGTPAPATGLGGFGGFGSPTPAAGATSFGGGGFGTPGASAPATFGAAPVLGGAPMVMPGMTNQQQQQQLMLQVASLQQQQQQQDVAGRIEMLRKKKDEITLNSNAAAAEASAAEQKPTPNLFSGFVGAKSQPPAFYRSSPRSSARIVPRGMRCASSPALSALPALSNAPATASSPATPYRGDNLLSPEPFSIGRSAKKLVVSSYRNTHADAADDLPPVPGSASSEEDTRMQQTPFRAEAPSTAAKASARSTGGAERGRGSEATGLTPGQTSTPYYPRGRHSQSPTPGQDARDGGHSEEDESAPEDPLNSSFASPVAFRLSAKDGSGRTASSRKSGVHGRAASPTPEAEENVAPILTRPGYICVPDITILQRCSARDLTTVPNFAVVRPGFGKIEWIGKTDLRGLNLDEIVKIEKREVFVYEDVTPVPEGTGLNKPAVVTLHNVFPKENTTEKKKAEFYHKLQDFCDVNDADFISYDRNTGDWVFGVKHFSRYGLDESDDEEENRPEMESNHLPAEESKSTAFSAPAKAPVSLASRNIQRLREMLAKDKTSAAFDLPSPPGMAEAGRHEKRRSALQLDPAPGAADDTESPPHTRRRTDGAWHADSNDSTGPVPMFLPRPAAFLTMEEVERAELKPSARTTTSAFNANTQPPAFHLVEDSPCMKIMLEVKARAAAATGLRADRSAAAYTKPELSSRAGVTSVSALQQPMSNYALSMGRSFRVGWSRDGTIVHAGKFTFAAAGSVDAPGQTHRIAVEKVDPLGWARKYKVNGMPVSPPESLLEAPLTAILNASHLPVHPPGLNPTEEAAQARVAPSLGKVPLWRLPLADPSELHEYVPFLTMLKATTDAHTSNAQNPKHPDWTVGKALQLIDATYGQETTVFSADPAVRAAELVPLYEDRHGYAPEVWERRRNMLSAWIESVARCEGEIRRENV
jgi:nuclear pore complex protein Nup98-Nup96